MGKPSTTEGEASGRRKKIGEVNPISKGVVHRKDKKGSAAEHLKREETGQRNKFNRKRTITIRSRWGTFYTSRRQQENRFKKIGESFHPEERNAKRI